MLENGLNKCLILNSHFVNSETTFSVEELLGMVLNNSREIAEKFAGKYDLH